MLLGLQEWQAQLELGSFPSARFKAGKNNMLRMLEFFLYIFIRILPMPQKWYD
jgi:hypothetical protein